jgi:pterin-4a-carbinolamine dehydratase
MKAKEFNEACWTGYRQQGTKRKGDRTVPNCVPVAEQRRDPQDLYRPSDAELDRLHHQFIPTWSMLDHDVLKTSYDFVDNDTALEFVNELAAMSEAMDHNAVIALDHARVTVQIRTGDVDGLTRLDFEFALRCQALADRLEAKQAAHITNAVMENLRDWFGKGKEGGAGGGGWDRYNTKGERIGKCGDSKPGEGKPKCLSKSRAASLRASGGKAAIAAAVRRKRAKDPNSERRGAAKMVSNRPKKNESRLNEFDRGEGGFGPFKVYDTNYFVGSFETLDDAREEVEFLRDADPRTANNQWRIVDGTGETVWAHDPGEAADAWRSSQKNRFVKKNKPDVSEDQDRGDIPAAVTKFYQDEVGNFSTKPVGNYKEVARALVQKAPTPSIRRKVINALVAAKDDPVIQGGVITIIGSALAGGVLSSAQQMGLNPGQTNIMLQAVLNTVIPTVVSFVNGKSLEDSIKYVLTSAVMGTGYAAISEAGKDACYRKVKSRYKVWPSAYASGALVRCRKVGAANWGNKSKK